MKHRRFQNSFSERFRYVDFPDRCAHALKITITHDPEGIFDDRVRGLAFAAHIHCGQPIAEDNYSPHDRHRQNDVFKRRGRCRLRQAVALRDQI